MGTNRRIEILRTKMQGINTIAEILGWGIKEIGSRDYDCILYSVSAEGIDGELCEYKIARLYDQSVKKAVYRQLEKEVNCILIVAGHFDSANDFSQGCCVPVIPESEFLYLITDWTLERLGIPEDPLHNERGDEKSFSKIHIIEENPEEQIYTHLRALTSKSVAAKAVERHAFQGGYYLEQEDIESKAEGVSYLVQNAIDYYSCAASDNMTQRLLNLYYGTLALMEAEMLMVGNTYSKLEEIEKITKNGHGMSTEGDAEDDFDNFVVMVINKGLFYKWLSNRGVNTKEFPKSWKEAADSKWKISLNDLLYCIPELENILIEVDANYHPGFLMPVSETKLRYAISGSSKCEYYQRKHKGHYLNFIDTTGRADPHLINNLYSGLVPIGPYKNETSGQKGWTVYIRPGEIGPEKDIYRTHKGLSASAVLKPLFGITNEWDVYAVIILYALSIIVRYRPNLWAKISHGKLDHYKAVFYQFSRVAERELTQNFLEILTGKKVIILNPAQLI